MPLKFISNLVHHLKRRLGWCPEPPTPKDVILTKIALYKGMVYVEKPSISWLYLLSPIFWWSFSYFMQWFPRYYHHGNPPAHYIPVLNIMSTLFVVFGVVMPLPFVLKRGIHLTPYEFHVKFGLYEDKVAINDIESIEQVKRPWTYVGPNGGPCGRAWMQWSVGILVCGVAITKGVKYYVFGGRRTYFKINKRNGDAVCIGVENPEEFMNRWKMLQSQQGNGVEAPQIVCACCGKPISYGEGWTEKENKIYHWVCWRQRHDAISWRNNVKNR